jgi:hypothetical protein
MVWKFVEVALAVGGLGTGLWAAWQWFAASKIEPEIWTHPSGVPLGPEEGRDAMMAATLSAMQASSKLNKRAALWSCMAVAIDTAGSVLSTFF